MTVKIKKGLQILLLIVLVAQFGCTEKAPKENDVHEPTESIRTENGATPASNQTEAFHVATEEDHESISTEADIDNNYPEVPGDINLTDIPISSLEEIKINSIDISQWVAKDDKVYPIIVSKDGKRINFILNYDSDSARLVVIEEKNNTEWVLAFSDVFPGLFGVGMSPSGKMLALVFRDDQRIALLDLEEKGILAEAEVYSPWPSVYWTEDEERIIVPVIWGKTLDWSDIVLEAFTVPTLELEEVVMKSDPENERWTAWGFWWSPDNEIDKYIIKTRMDLLYWEGENYVGLYPVDVEFENTPINIFWIDENRFLVTNPKFHRSENDYSGPRTNEMIFYLFNETEEIDEYRIIENSESSNHVSAVWVNSETMQISALLSTGAIVMLEIRDEKITSLCQVDIYSIPDFRTLRTHGFLSDSSIIGLSEDNKMYIISNITCE